MKPSRQLHVQVNNRNTRTRREICSKLLRKTQEQRYWRSFGVFIVSFEHISKYVSLLFLLFTYYLLWPGKCGLGRWLRIFSHLLKKSLQKTLISVWWPLPNALNLKSLVFWRLEGIEFFKKIYLKKVKNIVKLEYVYTSFLCKLNKAHSILIQKNWVPYLFQLAITPWLLPLSKEVSNFDKIFLKKYFFSMSTQRVR